MKTFDMLKAPLEGVNLIEASAGTGKTYTIANLYLRFLLEKELTVEQILVVTFTEAATKELKARLRANIDDAYQRLKHDDRKRANDDVNAILDAYFSGHKAEKDRKNAELRLRQAVVSFDEAAIFTIHGFCQRMLNENAFESRLPFDIELLEDDSELVTGVVNDYWRQLLYGDDGKLNNAVMKFKKINLDHLHKLAMVINGRPDMGILPDNPNNKNKEEIKGLTSQIKDEWDANKDKVISLIDVLKQNNAFKENQLQNIEKGLDILSRPEYEYNFAGLKLFSSDSLKNKIKKDYVSELPKLKFFELCDKIDEVVNDYATCIKRAFVDFFREKIEERKRLHRVRTFDDILLNLENALKNDESGQYKALIRKKFRAAMIDEFQDTDQIQYRIFNTLFMEAGADTTLFLIGDPKQSIYRFRGADIFAYLDAKSHVNQDKTWTLGTNYRSETHLIDAINHFFSKASNPFVEKDIPYLQVKSGGLTDKKARFIENNKKSTPRLRFVRIGKEKMNKYDAITGTIDFIVSEVTYLLNLGARGKCGFRDEDGRFRALRPGDIAILVDTHKNARDLHHELANFDVPSVLQSTGNVFESKEAGVMLRLLQAASEPSDRTIRPILMTDLIGKDQDDLKINPEAVVQEYYEKFMGLREEWLKHGFMSMLRRFLNDEGVRDRVLAQAGGERMMTNILHIAELLHEAESAGRLGPNAVVDWLNKRITEIEKNNEEHEIRLDRDDEAVKLITTHASKGLEFPIVFCAFEWSRSFDKNDKKLNPYYDKDEKRRILDLNMPKNVKKQLERETLAENIRLLYVAMTRARNLCYVPLPFYKTDRGGIEKSAIYYLIEEPRNIDGFLGTKAGADEIKEMYDALKGIVQSSDSTCSFSVPEHASLGYMPVQESKETLEAQDFKGRIDRYWGVASFSGLSKGSHELVRPARIMDEGEETADDAGLPAGYMLPKGANTGLAVHEVFEVLDFTKGIDEDVIISKAKKYRMGLQAAEAIKTMVDHVLNVDVIDGLRLRTIGPDACVKEMEFFYPLKQDAVPKLVRIFESHGKDDIAQSLNRLKNNRIYGFMNGFIDMLFKYKGKFYVLDWKTSYLGPRADDYTDEAIEQSMMESRYYLQYHIYVVAAHLFLGRKRLDYDYERDFGGVIYAYTRGMRRARPRHSIFFDRPSKGLIEDLTKLLTGVSQ